MAQHNLAQIIPDNTYTRTTVLNPINVSPRSLFPPSPPEKPYPVPVYITEKVTASDTRLRLNEFHSVRLREVSGLDQRGEWKVIDA